MFRSAGPDLIADIFKQEDFKRIQKIPISCHAGFPSFDKISVACSEKKPGTTTGSYPKTVNNCYFTVFLFTVTSCRISLVFILICRGAFFKRVPAALFDFSYHVCALFSALSNSDLSWVNLSIFLF
jgi:hypothetical protein